MARECIYCSNPVAAKAEHIIPRWLPLHMKETMGVTGRVLVVRESHKWPQGQKTPFGEYKAKILCDGCHAYFADLEGQASPLIKPMITGGRQLGFRYWEARTVATWAAKTAFGVLARDAAHIQPERQRRFLRENDEPPPDCGVLSMAYDSLQIRVFSAIIPLDGAEFGVDGPLHGYDVFMTFGHVASRYSALSNDQNITSSTSRPPRNTVGLLSRSGLRRRSDGLSSTSFGMAMSRYSGTCRHLGVVPSSLPGLSRGVMVPLR